ncbi:16S rRNA (cytosine(1402)-N(4))-methyltransferase RsmH [Candidatus Pelagibacter sp.]|jgi:16S rRNA (cytosine1402-N4)-methyltransferase|nr:16S rRNA (cytosine(1402)-N(4))-methyltransferase RsmH [Candidatus Pelagibacter sp.]MDA9890082.1 16S rRNA (cytosine(1402)-N(4))-methyltransferase RsmH [Candidatus Pelagibacter sp.]
MDATIVSEVPEHYPVLLKEIISIITPQYGGTFIDCTFGQGGYSKKILEFKNTKVIALDRDKDSEEKANQIKLNFEDRFIFKNIKFSQLNNLKLKNEDIRGVIFDLGYSYTQIKDPKKGLSFQSKGNLNMQMGLNNYSAEDAINQLDEKELDKIFKFFGDEKESKFISRNIVKERSKKKIDTQTLVEIIDKTKRKKNFKVHSATKVFQALRILVNKEISELIFGLINAAKVLKKDGVLAVVTFHSLEDKIVKYFLKSLSENKSISRYVPVTQQAETLFILNQKKAIMPTDKEVNENLPSRSAKLRYGIKKSNFYDFETDILDQFKNLIEIENFGDKL